MPKLTDFILKHERKLLLTAILLYIAIFSTICLWKYGIFAYDALDLAIFNQVFWNTAQGRLFEMSIHPHSYLGDHAGLIILPLSLIYRLFQDPRTLLILQTIALATAAWPIWLITKHLCLSPKGVEGDRHHKDGKVPVTLYPPWGQALLPLLMALAWLLNPLVHNINIFEFHLLPFALVPLMFAVLAYERGHKRRFILFVLLAMLVREDVAMVVAMFGVLASFERKSWWWRVVPIAVGAAWFAGAMALIAQFAPAGSYKFAVYYSWLGSTPGEMATNAALNPLKVLAHIFSIGNLEMLIGFGLPLLFLPFLAPRFLVLAAGPFLQIIMGAPGGSSVVLDTHYSTLFLPALFLATIYALKREGEKVRGRERLIVALTRKSGRNSILVLFAVAVIYGALTMGPLPHVAARIISGEDVASAHSATKIIEQIPEGAAVAASYRLLPHLSSREHIYSNHYIFLGVKQFNAGPYEAPEDIEYVVFDADDLATYRAQFTNIAWTRAHYEGGRARLAAVAGGKIAREEKFILFGSSGAQELRSSGAETKIGFDFGIDIWLDGVHIDSDKRTMSLYWTLGAEKNDTKLVTVLLRQDGELLDIYRTPLINDLHQSAGPSDEYVQEIDLGPLVANYQAGRYIIGITLSEHDATHVLDGIRSTAEHFTELRETGGVDDVGSIDL